MKTTLNDLNDYLFSQLDRLSNEDLTGEELNKEIERANAITSTAKAIIDNGKLALDAKKHMDEYGYGEKVALTFLENKA